MDRPAPPRRPRRVRQPRARSPRGDARRRHHHDRRSRSRSATSRSSCRRTSRSRSRSPRSRATSRRPGRGRSTGPGRSSRIVGEVRLGNCEILTLYPGESPTASERHHAHRERHRAHRERHRARRERHRARRHAERELWQRARHDHHRWQPWWLMARMRRRMFAWLAIAFGAGIAIGVHAWGQGPWWHIALAVLALAFVSGAIAWRLTRPLILVVRAARDIGDGKLDTRIDPRAHGGEVRLLAAAINDMASKIQQQLADQRQLLAAVSHELRTPLGHMRVLIETARDRGDARALAELEARGAGARRSRRPAARLVAARVRQPRSPRARPRRAGHRRRDLGGHRARGDRGDRRRPRRGRSDARPARDRKPDRQRARARRRRDRGPDRAPREPGRDRGRRSPAPGCRRIAAPMRSGRSSRRAGAGSASASRWSPGSRSRTAAARGSPSARAGARGSGSRWRSRSRPGQHDPRRGGPGLAHVPRLRQVTEIRSISPMPRLPPRCFEPTRRGVSTRPPGRGSYRAAWTFGVTCPSVLERA